MVNKRIKSPVRTAQTGTAPITSITTAVAQPELVNNAISGPVQLITEKGDFSFTENGKLLLERTLQGKKDFYVVSILGVQGSGKSFLMNKLFHTSFPVGKRGRGKETAGIWASVVQFATHEATDVPPVNVLVLDVEGSDCAISAKQRATAGAKATLEDHSPIPHFESVAAAFVMQISNVICINVDENAVGTSTGGGAPLLGYFFRAALESDSGVTDRVDAGYKASLVKLKDGITGLAIQGTTDLKKLANSSAAQSKHELTPVQKFLNDYLIRSPAIFWVIRNVKDPSTHNEQRDKDAVVETYNNFFNDDRTKEMCPVERIVVRSLPLPQPEATVVEPEELYQMYKKVLELQFDKHVAVLRDAIREQIRSSTVTLTTEQMHSCLKHTAELVVHKTWSGDASELQARADCKKCADEVEDDFVTGRDGSPGTVRLIGGDLEAFKLVLEAAVSEWAKKLRAPTHSRSDIVCDEQIKLKGKLQRWIDNEVERRQDRVLSLKAQWNQQESLGPKEMAKVQVICSDVKRKIAGLEKLGAVDAQLKAYDISNKAKSDFIKLFGNDRKSANAMIYLELVLMNDDSTQLQQLVQSKEVKAFWQSFLSSIANAVLVTSYAFGKMVHLSGTTAATVGTSAAAISSSLVQVMSLVMLVIDTISKFR